MAESTLDPEASETEGRHRQGPRPGLVLVFSAGKPRFAVLPLGEGLSLGRGAVAGVAIEDRSVSRNHAGISLTDGEWRVSDLGSRNGTSLDGAPVRGEARFSSARVLRVGETLFLPTVDLTPWLGARVEVKGDAVVGPVLRAAWERVARAASGQMLHLVGESGSGKELAAREFHARGPRPNGPFVAVNCGALPPAIADRLLFGARRGAYSGADADADGHLQAADGGTLFLDEIAELAPEVQVKLLRALDTREVLPLGAVKPVRVDLRLCSATNQELRAHVAAGKFREDLYHRIGEPSVRIPALRQRLEEIPWLIARELQGGPAVQASFVEECLLRAWPGNVRELRVQVRQAALEAGDGKLKAKHLSPSAGQDFAGAPAPERGQPPDRAAIEDALRRGDGNIAAAARALGTHRTQLRRWMDRLGIQAMRRR